MGAQPVELVVNATAAAIRIARMAKLASSNEYTSQGGLMAGSDGKLLPFSYMATSKREVRTRKDAMERCTHLGWCL